MAHEFAATSDLLPGRIRVSWAERAKGKTRPPFQLVRRRFAFPTAVSDGAPVFDIDALYHLSGGDVTAWERIERQICVAGNTPAEDGFVRGMLEVFYDHGAPARVVIRTYDTSTDTLQAVELTGAFRVQQSYAPAIAPYTRAEYWDVYEETGPGEVHLGTIEFQEVAADPDTPNEMVWVPVSGPPRVVKYRQRRAERVSSLGPTFSVTDSGGASRGQLSIESHYVVEADVTEWRFAIEDGALEPGAFYYYRLFGPADQPDDPPVRASALATADYGSHDRLYHLLPPVFEVQDLDPDKLDRGRPLFRFLEAFGRGIDHCRGLVDAIGTRHDIATSRADFLPHLARMIGWIPDFTVPENTQRQDIRFAPEVFGGVGTVRSAPELVNRVTGWGSKIKEFAHNVFLTNAPEFIRIWEIWQVTRNGPNAWSAPAPFATTTSMDGAATALLETINNLTWIVWHSDRRGQRELWVQRLPSDTAPHRVMGPPAPGADIPTFVDESPALVLDGSHVRLFWTSTREGSRDIYEAVLDPATGIAGPAVRRTDHAMDDSHPTAVADGAGDLWLFWDSDRRGPRDIWYQRRRNGLWDEPARMPKSAGNDLANDSSPAAIMVGVDVWLFWCRAIGAHCHIWHQVIAGGDVSGLQAEFMDDIRPGIRDEAPAPVLVPTMSGTQVWLLFHSNRAGPWRIWTRVYDGAWPYDPSPLSPEVTADTEPTGYVDTAGLLHVLWTSQRRTRWYKSRTFDLSDAGMIAELGKFHDHAHYIYDTGENGDDWYARGAVGVYLEPDEGGDVIAAAKRADAFLAPFRAACVRYVWPTGDLAHEETIEVGAFVGETWSDA